MRMQYNLMYNLMLLYIYINVTLCPILKPNLIISLRLLILTSIKELAGCIDRLYNKPNYISKFNLYRFYGK